MNGVASGVRNGPRVVRRRHLIHVDSQLLFAVVLLVSAGLVMVCSASITIADRQLGQPFYYLLRQLMYVGVGVAAGMAVATIRLEHWERIAPLLLLVGMLLLVLVFIPGLGREVNGSRRWLGFGPLNLQASEMMKLFMIVYLSSYLVRHGEEARTTVKGFLKPIFLFAIAAVLLLAEPDLGATAVIAGTVTGMLFLAGVRLKHLSGLILVLASLLVVLILIAPYRMARMTSFLDPWADPFNSGFQLTQALIAFGRGEWFGVGLGNSVQKLFYLPEAHTDFLFAVLAEEFGLAGVACVVFLFALVVWRAFRIASLALRAGQPFAAYTAYGIGLWIGMQAVINMGVNMGALPTKGLTLPLMSFGGSSIVVMLMAVALLMRIYHEAHEGVASPRRTRGQP